MTLEPLLSAPPAVQFHVATVIPAAVLGAHILANPKGTPIHRTLGKFWLLLMIATCISTFFIHELDLLAGFSPIHLLSIYVIVGAARAYTAARRHDVAAHRGHVCSIYFGGIVVAGIFTFLPNRIMYDTFFLGSSAVASIFSAAVLATLFTAAASIVLRQSGWFRQKRAARKST